MKITSCFRDYYDIGMGLGHDTSISFIRTPRDVILNRSTNPEASPEEIATIEAAKGLPAHAGGREYGFHCIVIGFCGRFYPVVVFPNGNFPENKPLYCHSSEEADNHIFKCLNKNAQKIYESEHRWGVRYQLKSMFEKYQNLPVNMEPFIINRSPLVVLYERHDFKTVKAVWNARLRDYNFERVVPPYKAFQEIEMFLGNLATPEKPIPPRSDNQKVQSHGFDVKWSFRKQSKENKEK